MTLVWSERTRTWIDSPRFHMLARPWRRVSASAPSDHLECWDLGAGGSSSLTGLHGTVLTTVASPVWGNAIHGLQAMSPAFAYTSSTAFRLYADATYVLGLMLINNTQTADGFVFGYVGQSIQNSQYNTPVKVSILSDGQLSWLQEYGTKLPATHSVPWVFPVGCPGILTARRASQRISFFWNETQLGATSDTLPEPTGGSNAGSYSVVDLGQSTMPGLLFGHAVYDRALTDAEIQSMARGIMGL